MLYCQKYVPSENIRDFWTFIAFLFFIIVFNSIKSNIVTINVVTNRKTWSNQKDGALHMHFYYTYVESREEYLIQ